MICATCIPLNDNAYVYFLREFSITSMTGNYRRVFQRPIDFVWYAHFKSSNTF